MSEDNLLVMNRNSMSERAKSYTLTIGKKLKGKLTGPTAIWFYSLYFITLFMMILMSFLENGVSWSSFVDGPVYYLNLILNYGLNGIHGEHVNPFNHFVSFFISPLFMMLFGVTLFMLTDAGFAMNGGAPEDPYGNFLTTFFNEPVFGADVYIGDHYKWNLFYLELFSL